MILNNEVEIAIERVLDSSTPENEVKMHLITMWGWMVQQGYLTNENVGEYRTLQRDPEAFATKAHDLLVAESKKS